MSNNKRNNGNEMPVIDEGWWDSVLAEEGQFSAHHTRPQVAAKPVFRSAPQKSQPIDAKPQTQVAEAVKADWDMVKDLYKQDRIIPMTVTGHNRGGLLVEGEGVSGFVPFSHLVELAGKTDITERTHELESYMGKTLNVKVIECVPEDGRVVFSERAALSEPGKRAELFHSLNAGSHVRGQVTNITDFGVFVDLGGVEGLIHISELSWGRVIHPNQIVSLGQEIDVQVMDISPERCRVALSLKRLNPNPWERASTDFSEGQVLPATVTTIVSYGAFARLDVGVEGLIHATEIPMAAGSPLRDVLKEGQQIQVRILHIDAAHQRMGLSLRTEN